MSKRKGKLLARRKPKMQISIITIVVIVAKLRNLCL